MNNPQAKALTAQVNNMLHIVCGIQTLSAADKQRMLESVQELLQAVSEMPTQEKAYGLQNSD